MDYLSPLDDAFITLERDSLPMHIGSLLILEGPAPAYDDVLAYLAGRLDLLPRYRQVAKTMPLSIGPAVWLDDPHFDLSYHVRHTALPRPGTEEQLRTLTGRVLSLRLDMDRPPWEMWLVEGLADGRWAIINKVHHSMVDGLSGADLMEVLLDDSPEVDEPEPSTWEPEPWPDPIRLVGGSLLTGVLEPVQRLRHLGDRLSAPARAAQAAAVAAVGTLRLGRELAHTEDHLLGTPGPHRRWAWALGDLTEVKRIKTELGGTVNDVILAAVTNGLREFLLGRGVELTAADTVRTMVPVSTRPPGAPSGGNDVAALFTDLPVGISDPAARFAEVRASMVEVKNSGLLVGVDSLINNAVFIPPALLTAAGKLAARTPQASVATITTNVPGPQLQLYFLGRPVERVMPYVPIGMHQLTAIAIISYNGQINCGVTADYDQVPDVTVISEGIEVGLAQLAEVAGLADQG